MSIRRTATAGDRAAIIQRAALQDTRLSWRARGILAGVLSRPRDWRTDAQQLARESPTEGRDAIQGALRELERCGYLRRIRERGEGGRWVWRWDLSDDASLTPEPVENPDDEAPNEPDPEPEINTGGGVSAGQTINGLAVYGPAVDGSAEDGPAVDGKPGFIQGIEVQGRETSSSGSQRTSPERPPDDDDLPEPVDDAGGIADAIRAAVPAAAGAASLHRTSQQLAHQGWTPALIEAWCRGHDWTGTTAGGVITTLRALGPPAPVRAPEPPRRAMCPVHPSEPAAACGRCEAESRPPPDPARLAALRAEGRQTRAASVA